MYPETMAKDNRDLADRRPPRHGIHLGSAKPAGARRRFLDGRLGWAAFYLMLAVLFNCEAQAGDRLSIAVQKTGTFAWELSIIKARGLDKKAGLDLEITEFASPEATKITLLGGSADIILSDWLWVARERNRGDRLVFFPYSTALGAVLVKDESPIKDLAGLRGKTIAVAGGPLDKSWVLLQAFAQQLHFDIASDANVVYGAPGLLYEKALTGEAEATLNFWNFCVALEAHGFRQLVGMDEVERQLGAKGPVSMIGYVFGEDFARRHPAVLARFLKVTAEAKEILAHSGADWKNIAQQIGISDDAQLALYKKRYIDGIPRRPVEAEAADARVLYQVLAKTGGEDLAGPAKELDEKIYYKASLGFRQPGN